MKKKSQMKETNSKNKFIRTVVIAIDDIQAWYEVWINRVASSASRGNPLMMPVSSRQLSGKKDLIDLSLVQFYHVQFISLSFLKIWRHAACAIS